ncbi:MAG: HmuY family protein [Gemmatimonadetes bacterium]|nr:HmuY family protein [Gemmatimonadota bacterium]
MRLPLPLTIIAILFAVVMAFLVVTALVPRRVPTYALPPAPRSPPAALVEDTVTIDARDPGQWRFFDFARGPLTPPDTAGWDLAVRRFHVIVAGEALRLDTVTFEALREAPPDGYAPTAFTRDTSNPAITRWYRYSMFSHLLRPKPLTYAIHSRDGRYAKLEFLSYYCPGPEPGCVTFRYVVGEPGSRMLR